MLDNNKRVVLAFNKYFIPGYKAGGPIRTLANMVDRLADEFDFRIVTLDRDAGDAEPYRDIPKCEWMKSGNAHVYYLPRTKVSVLYLVRLIKKTRPDAIYLNSFFDACFTQKALIARRFCLLEDVPVILASRGEFSSGAMGLKSVKKQLYLKAARILGLYNGLTWQASTEREAEEIRLAFPPARNARLKVARDLAPAVGTELATPDSRSVDSDHPLKVCFLSRVSPMKNLDFALRVLAHVTVPVHFTIYGPKEDASYWDECQALADELPENVSAEFYGSVTPHEVREHLEQHDVFLFPTRGENYGHVIFEALAAGLYVILSDQTPWQDLQERSVGTVLPLSDERGFAAAIEETASWSNEQWAQLRQNSVRYAAQVASDEETLQANRQLFAGSS